MVKYIKEKLQPLIKEHEKMVPELRRAGLKKEALEQAKDLKKYKKVGRPTKMTPENIAKLEIAFSNGATDLEACFVAGISKDTLYDYIKLFPEFSDRKEALKDQPKYQARVNVVEAIRGGDKPTSTWYLERKAKEEFASRTENTGKDGKDLIPENTPEIIAKSKLFDDWYKQQLKGD
jgi:hypothetical protein